jgi:MFS family permease
MTHDNHERKRWLALIVLCLGVLMIVLDTTIVNVALPSIRADLGFNEISLMWVVNAYSSAVSSDVPGMCRTQIGCAVIVPWYAWGEGWQALQVTD